MLSSLLLRRRRMAASMLLCLLTALTARVSARQEPPSTNPNYLELVISGPREDFPDRPSRLFHPRKFKVTLINHSSRAIVFGPNAPRVIPGYPTSDWRVLDPNGKLVPFRPLYICRVGALTRVPTLPMTDANLFVIHPGERRDLDDLDISMWFQLTEPGEYKIYREFSFSPPRLTQVVVGGVKYSAEYDTSAMSPEKRQMLRYAASFTVKSNVWTLVIK